MTKVKTLSILCAVLLLSNIVLLTFLGLGFIHNQQHAVPKKEIIQRLHFDKDQIDSYEAIIQNHRAKTNTSITKMNQLKSSLYYTLNLPNSSEQKESIIAEISKVQANIEAINYAHFEEIKQICKPDQQADFEKLTKDLSSLFSPQKPPIGRK